MHVIVVGCGRVGSSLAADLDDGGHTVAVIDRAPEAFRRLPEWFRGSTHHGVGFDHNVLSAAGGDRADAVAAVTSGDNSNIVVARMAREAFGVERVVARIYDPTRAQIYARLGIPTVPTSQWTVDQVLRHIDPAEHATDWTDPTGTLSLIGLPLPRHLAGTDAPALDLGDHAHVVAVTREGQARHCHPELVFQEGDLVHVLVDTDHLADSTAPLRTTTEEGH